MSEHVETRRRASAPRPEAAQEPGDRETSPSIDPAVQSAMQQALQQTLQGYIDDRLERLFQRRMDRRWKRFEQMYDRLAGELPDEAEPSPEPEPEPQPETPGADAQTPSSSTEGAASAAIPREPAAADAQPGELIELLTELAEEAGDDVAGTGKKRGFFEKILGER